MIMTYCAINTIPKNKIGMKLLIKLTLVQNFNHSHIPNSLSASFMLATSKLPFMWAVSLLLQPEILHCCNTHFKIPILCMFFSSLSVNC